MSATEIDTHHLVTVSVIEAGTLLGLSRTQTYKHAREQTFPVPVLRVVGKLRVRVVDLERYLEDAVASHA